MVLFLACMHVVHAYQGEPNLDSEHWELISKLHSDLHPLLSSNHSQQYGGYLGLLAIPGNSNINVKRLKHDASGTRCSCKVTTLVNLFNTWLWLILQVKTKMYIHTRRIDVRVKTRATLLSNF